MESCMRGNGAYCRFCVRHQSVKRLYSVWLPFDTRPFILRPTVVSSLERPTGLQESWWDMTKDEQMMMSNQTLHIYGQHQGIQNVFSLHFSQHVRFEALEKGTLLRFLINYNKDLIESAVMLAALEAVFVMWAKCYLWQISWIYSCLHISVVDQLSKVQHYHP